MVSKTVDSGNYGRFSTSVTLVSQSQSGNSSRVAVRGRLHNDAGSRSWNGNPTGVHIDGEDTWNGSVEIDIPGGGDQLIIDREFVVPHGSTGYKTVRYGIDCDDTDTYNLGNPPRVVLELTLPRIPKPPDRVSTPSRSFTAPNDVTVSWSAPDNNGDSIDEYQIQVDTNSSFSSPSTYNNGTSRSKKWTSLSINTKYYWRVRAHNSAGWGDWSAATSYDIPDHPATPGRPTLVYTPATTMKIDWAAVSNGGASIQKYQIQYADNSSYSGYKLKEVGGSTTVLTVSDLTVGETWYFRVRAVNSQGAGSWSSSASLLVVCGPRVRVNGTWRNTIAYVRVNGAWKVATPYVRANGSWKVAGG